MTHESSLTEFVQSLGLPKWTVVWQPDATQPKLGRIIPETKVILIHAKEPKVAIRTIIHEVVELKLRAASNVERSLSNALIEWANKQAYQAKERAIEEVLDLIFDLVENSDDLRDILKEATPD